jgi:hypothetical protein
MEPMKRLLRVALLSLAASSTLPLTGCEQPSPADPPAASSAQAVEPAATAAPVAAAVAEAPAPGPVQRCGWLQNPTPANWWLVDRDGEWVLGVQGGHQATGLDELPDLTERDWVVTNGSSYGYGCACLTVEVDEGAKQITRIVGGVQQKPISACRADRRLPPPNA